MGAGLSPVLIASASLTYLRFLRLPSVAVAIPLAAVAVTVALVAVVASCWTRPTQRSSALANVTAAIG